MPTHRLNFPGNLVLDLELGCLLRNGHDLKLRPKSFHVLTYLAEQSGRLVGKEELVRAVWPDTFVSDDSLTKCVGEIRRALGDGAQGLLKTVPKRGYVFAAAVEEHGSPMYQTNLPLPVTRFVGRETEIADLLQLLDRERLVTLTGAGGCGKTRLALQAAAAVTPRFPDGVWLTELGAIAEDRLVADAVAASMGVRSGPRGSMLQCLQHYVSRRSVLLVLDNCEHLVGACAELTDALLRSCPQIQLLATSREPLRIAGEQAYRVPCLSLPSENASFDEIQRSEAVGLMVARTTVVRPSFALTPANAAVVAGLCARLDGIPLAIELAAARAAALSFEQMASRLNDRFTLLVGGSRTAPARQQTLRATVDWSYDLLTDAEKRLLRRLSVFAGGWTLEAADAVCLDESEGLSVLDGLSALVDKSLVLSEDDATGARRFRMLEGIREYGRDRLAETGESAEMRRRHLAWCQQVARVAQRELKGSQQAEWLARLTVEHENLRSALAWCEASPELADVGLELSAALHWFWFKCGHFDESRRWLRSLLVARPPVPPDCRGLAAECWFSLGLSTILTGDSEEGRSYLETGLSLARELGDHRLIVVILRMMVQGLVDAGEFEIAEATASEALKSADAVESPWEKGIALGAAGIVRRARGDFAAAATYFRQEMEMHRVSGDQWMLAVAAADAAEAELHRGNVELARSLTLEMLCRASSAVAPDVAWNLEILGRALAASGDGLTAARVLGSAEAVFERIGLTTPAYWTLAYQRAIHDARALVDDDAAFTRAWAEGRRLSPAAAVALAQPAA